jgi:hypothetical protein
MYIMEVDTCPACNHEVAAIDHFCSNCGVLLNSSDARAAVKLNEAVRATVAREIETRYGEREVVEFTIAADIASRLVTWAKVYGAIAAFLIALAAAGLTLLGYQSYSDLKAKIETAKKEVEPVLKAARQKASEIAEAGDSLRNEQYRQRGELRGMALINQEVLQLAEKVAELEDRSFKGAPGVSREQLAEMQSALVGFRIYLAGVGYMSNKRVEVVVGPPEADFNAYYDPATGQIIIGRQFMNDQDVLFHEYTERALLEIQGNWLLSNEDPVLYQIDEGLSDYFACSYRNDPKVAVQGAAELRKLDSNLQSALRDLTTQKKFASDITTMESHAGGEIWAATLWGLRGQLGQTTTDRIALEAWKAVKPSDRGHLQVNFVRRLIEADRQLNSGRHYAVIRQAFLRRGLDVGD